jgi:signal transduction histidine kinase
MRRLFNRDNMITVPSSIEDVVRELTSALDLLATDMGIKLIVHVDAPLPRVVIDRLRIQHVLYTLAQNAFDATTTNTSARQRLVKIESSHRPFGPRNQCNTRVLD